MWVLASMVHSVACDIDRSRTYSPLQVPIEKLEHYSQTELSFEPLTSSSINCKLYVQAGHARDHTNRIPGDSPSSHNRYGASCRERIHVSLIVQLVQR